MSATLLLILRLALTSMIYVFLGLTIWFFWQDLRRHTERQSPGSSFGQSLPISLRQEQDSGQRVFHFTGNQVVIGRDQACECCLDELTISARHARLAYHHGQWWVEDLQSTNGTFLNDVPVSDPIVLTSGDRLQCGQHVLFVNIAAQSLLE